MEKNYVKFSRTDIVDIPKFKETLWEWRTFGIRVDIRRNILRLPIKDTKSIKIQDRYLCGVGRDTNINIRWKT